jgi:hypothetical protein
MQLEREKKGTTNSGLDLSMMDYPETSQTDSFWQVSGFFYEKKKYCKKVPIKNFGNLPETSAAGFQRFPAGFRIIHH